MTVMAACHCKDLLLVLILAAVFYSVVDGSGTNVQNRKFWKAFARDVIINGAIESASGVPSVRKCADLCARHDHCLSLAFQPASQSCWLYPGLVPFNKTGVQSAPATRYYWSYTRRCPSQLNYTFSSPYGICYKVVTLDMTWFQARDLCAAEGGNLFIGDSTERFDFLVKVIGTAIARIRVGGSDEQKEGEWLWLNGRPVQGPWDSGSPEIDPTKNCLTFDRLDGYYDGRCTLSRNYLCEIPVVE